MDTVTAPLPQKRSDNGRFINGNTLGNRFLEGNTGRSKGSPNKETVVTRVIADKVLRLDPDRPGKRLSNRKYHIMLNAIAHKHPKIMMFFLEHRYGKVPDEVVQSPRIVILPPLPPTEGTKAVEGRDTTIDMVSNDNPCKFTEAQQALIDGSDSPFTPTPPTNGEGTEESE
jgi:hypothetical protein